MIRSHREYKEALSDYAIDLYFWGVYAPRVDISDVENIRELFNERLKELCSKLHELEEWATSRQPMLVYSDDTTERTLSRGRLYPIPSSTAPYVENIPAGIFDQEEAQSTTNTGYDDRTIYAGKTRWKARERLRKLLNDESNDFADSCLGSEADLI